MEDKKPCMTPEDFTAKMEEISNNMDKEERHIDADILMCDILRSLGYEKGVEIFRSMDKWYA